MFQSVNPSSGEILAEYQPHTPQEWKARVERSAKEFKNWRRSSFAERSALVLKLAELLRKRSTELSRLMTLEMGKRISEARAEVEKCAACAEYLAKEGERMLASEEAPSAAQHSYIRFDPLGVILGVMPWNFPLWQVVRFAVPALLAGNVVLLKHASNVSGSALALEQLFENAGFPPNAFQVLLISGSEVDQVIRRPEIAAVSLTGSDGAGRSVAAAAGAVLKKCVLELGGSDPFIVLADVNVEQVAEAAVSARLICSGQSCIAAKRFLVERPVFDRFVECMAARFTALRIGDPLSEDTQLGPLAREDLVTDLERQVRESLAQGARLHAGGSRDSRAGCFFQPTLLEVGGPSNIAFAEETFGPVAAVMRVESAEEAVAVANTTPFGLGASIWTKDTRHAEQLAGEIESGMVFINSRVASDVRLPFGGIKASGYGRELGLAGIREFTNLKTVYVA